MIAAMEVWKRIPGWDKYYISNRGNVRNGDTGKILKHTKRKGYHGVTLYFGDRFKIIRIHAYMVRIFTDNWDTTLVAAHMDGDKDNNTLENIKLITQAENIMHKHIHGTMAIGPRNFNSKLTVDQVLYIKKQLRMKSSSIIGLAKLFGVVPNAISNIKSGKSYSYIKEESR